MVWQIVASGLSLKSVYVTADGRRGWAVGDHATIVATEDGGAHWTFARRTVGASRLALPIPGGSSSRLVRFQPVGRSELQRMQQRRGSLPAEQITWQRLARLLAVEAPCERLTFQVIRELNGDDERVVGL